MKKQDLKNYNRLLKMENEALEHLLQEAENGLGDDSYCEEIALILEENNELVKDLNDTQADMAADHADYRKTLINLVEKNTRASDENVRLQSKIAVLEKEKAQLAKKNQCLLEDLETAGKRIRELRTEKEENK